MSKIIIVALALALLLLGFSGAVFAYSLPLWLPIVLVVLSVVLVALLASKVAKSPNPRRYSATTGGMAETPRYRAAVETPPNLPLRPR
jgi:membrane protein implicated in regulation of membrane protease activity